MNSFNCQNKSIYININFISIEQLRKVQHQQIKKTAQSHIDSQFGSKDSKPGNLVLSPCSQHYLPIPHVINTVLVDTESKWFCLHRIYNLTGIKNAARIH